MSQIDFMASIIEQTTFNSLLKDMKNRLAGFVCKMDFHEATVLTNDLWKEKVLGIPHNSFLIASYLDPENFGKANNLYKEIILLRVVGAVSLPDDVEMLKTRIEHSQNRTTAEIPNDGTLDGLDIFTQGKMQYGGLKCNILGSFYSDEKGRMHFGSDLENYMALSPLRVYKPHPDSLEKIINHVNHDRIIKSKQDAQKAGFKDLPETIEIGAARYTSTTRMQRLEKRVPVRIHPADFLSRRTAVFGMTRTGKSNMIKTMISAIMIASIKGKTPIGQIIFDVNGEYANANQQDDGSSISSVFDNMSDIYKIGKPSRENVRDLRFNFYTKPDDALKLMSSIERMKNSGNAADYGNFLSSSLERPEKTDYEQYQKWEIRAAMFFCMLKKAGFDSEKYPLITFKVAAAIADKINPDIKPVDARIKMDINKAVEWFDRAGELHRDGQLNVKKDKPWFGDETLISYLNVLNRKNSQGTAINGCKNLSAYISYHSPFQQDDTEKEINLSLDKGKIVIIDLSTGNPEIREKLSKNIAWSIFNKNMSVLNNGGNPRNIIMYIEEAHNLIGVKDEITEVWPRVAKEGAKANISLVYSTQEPSSINKNILANTENFFVTHLNNDDELKVLGKFYDFADFIPSLKNAQDVGFARVKTLSSPFVVPTQIKKFDPELLINEIKMIGGGNAIR